MRPRVLLLGAQSLCLGLSSAFLIVAATSVFLATYGADLLPYAYLAVAAGGVLVSWAMTSIQRRLSLAGLATSVLLALAALLAAGWAAVGIAGWTWATFPLVVLVFLWIPVGFVLVGSQSGRLLDIQQLKAWFPRIAAGFAAGFGIGGLAAARLVSVVGDPVALLLVDVVVVIVFLGLVLELARRHPAELRSPPQPRAASADPSPRMGARRLLGNRLVVVLLGYQLLSAAVTQLLDYLVWSSAAERYPDPVDLARFLGLFGALINVVGLVFVFTLAGLLLSRYGVRFGLAANPAGVVVLVVAGTVVGLLGGAGTTLFFVLVCAQQVVDIALTDGTTRGSINAAYQALGPRDRLAAQTQVEGVGVPAAIGAVGVLLLVMQALDAGAVALLVVVLVLSVAWLVLAGAAFRLYSGNLRSTLTRRAWDPVALRLDDDASRDVVRRMLAGDDLRDVAVALDALAAGGSPEDLGEAVGALLGSDDAERVRLGVSAAGAHHLGQHRGRVALVASRDDLPGDVRSAATCTAAALGATAADIEPLLQDDDRAVRIGAAVGLLHVRGSDDDRARVEGLLVDDHDSGPALVALAQLPSVAAVPALLAAAGSSPRPRGIVDALAAHADHLVPEAADALASAEGARTARTCLLVHSLAAGSSTDADALLAEHLLHPRLEVRDAVLDTLAARPRRPSTAALREALGSEASRAALALDALGALAGDGRLDTLRRALRDDLDATAARAGTLLDLLHPGAGRTAVSLAGPDRSAALETLEITCGRDDARLALALLDPRLDDTGRRAGLGGAAVSLSADEWVADLALDPEGRWQDAWLRAAAVWSSRGGAAALAGAAAADSDAVVAETARAVLSRS